MNVGVDASELQGRPTGTGRYLRNLLRVWCRTTEDRFFAYFNGPAPADPVLDHPRIVVRSTDEPVRGLWWQQATLPSAAGTDALDVFFSPAFTCPLLLDVPRVTAIHDLSFFSIPDDFAFLDGLRRRILVRASQRVSSRILVISDFTRRELLGRFPDAAGRVVCIPLAADVDDLPQAPSRADARAASHPEGPRLLSVGSLFNRRRVPALIQAMAMLSRSHPNATLDIVGENRTHPRLDLEAQVRRLGLGQRVRFWGFVGEAELALRYASADVAVYLSEYEGLGLPVLEAMARGIPVVTSVRPATGEVFREAALLVDPADPTDVAAALDRVLRDRDLRSGLARRGLDFAARLSWTRTAALTREALAAAAR